MARKFWLVWNENPDTLPRHKHDSLKSAMDEAERLTRQWKNGGNPFHVMELKKSCEKNDVLWQNPDEDYDSQIPF